MSTWTLSGELGLRVGSPRRPCSPALLEGLLQAFLGFQLLVIERSCMGFRGFWKGSERLTKV